MNEQLLYSAVERNDLTTVTHLISREVDINSRCRRGGWNVSMKACRCKNKEMVRLLLKNGAAVNERHICEEEAHPGAKIHATSEDMFFVSTMMTDDGWTALTLAVSKGAEEIVDLLIKHHSDVMKRSKWGQTAIHCAGSGNHVTILDRLLSCGSSVVDVTNNKDQTPLWFAARYGHISCVKLLLKYGADLQHKSQEGSPLEVAKQRGHNHIVRTMEEVIRSGGKVAADEICQPTRGAILTCQLEESRSKERELAAKVTLQNSEIQSLKTERSPSAKEVAPLKARLARIQAISDTAGDDAMSRSRPTTFSVTQ